jgi:hypothetical protein
MLPDDGVPADADRFVAAAGDAILAGLPAGVDATADRDPLVSSALDRPEVPDRTIGRRAGFFGSIDVESVVVGVTVVGLIEVGAIEPPVAEPDLPDDPLDPDLTDFELDERPPGSRSSSGGDPRPVPVVTPASVP